MTSAEKAVIEIRPMKKSDYPQVKEILQQGMNTGQATFEGNAPEEFAVFTSARINDLLFVAVKSAQPEEILGWVSASPTSHRPVFSGVIEDSIYVSPKAAGQGVAGKLLDHLLAAAAEAGYWSMHASIFPENEGSVKLHESRGYRKIGILHCMAKMEYGPKKGQWRHNLILEKILEQGPAWEAYQEREAADRLNQDFKNSEA